MGKVSRVRNKPRPSTRDRIEVHRSDLEKARRIRVSGGDVWFRHPFPRKLYKYVDAEHAQAVQDGAIKIGTIRSYADLENGRDDDAEGTSVIYPNNISLQKDGVGDEEIRRGMREIGLHALSGVEIHGAKNAIRFTAETPNYLCYCLSLIPRSQSLLKAGNQTVFEIVSFEHFLLQLLTKLQVDVAWVGAIEYSSRTFTKFDGPRSLEPNGFLKPYRRESDGYRFDKEREYRILMMPQEGASTDPYGPDPLLAPFFRKLST